MYNQIPGPRRTFKTSDGYRKEWKNINPQLLEKWLNRINKVFPGYVLNHGIQDNYMFVDLKYIKGIPASQIIHTNEFIDSIINFCVQNIKETYPYAHMDWSMSNIIVNNNTFHLVDWDNLGLYPLSLIEYTLNKDLKTAFGSKLQHYITLEI